jgi:hypothetical protein
VLKPFAVIWSIHLQKVLMGKQGIDNSPKDHTGKDMAFHHPSLPLKEIHQKDEHR